MKAPRSPQEAGEPAPLPIAFLWHVQGPPWAPRRCRHRVLTVAGDFILFAARCGKAAPDPAAPWEPALEIKVRQLHRRALDVQQPGHPIHTWYSARPPLPKKAPPPEPRGPMSEEQRRILEDMIGGDPLRRAARLLGLPWPCDPASVKTAYRRVARQHHPDVGGNPAAFRIVTEARDVLLGRPA